MARDHIVHPRWIWAGVLVALTGTCLLALWTATWETAAGVAGAALLAVGGLTAARAGVLYDTHGGRPITGEVKDIHEARSHEGTAPGDMITDPRIRAHAAMASRHSEAVRRASQPMTRPALQPMGAWLVLIGAASLILAQGSYPHTSTGQLNATRSLLLAVVVALIALRALLAQRPGRILAALSATGGVVLIAFAILTAHDRRATMCFELLAGSWIFLTSLLCLDRPPAYSPVTPARVAVTALEYPDTTAPPPLALGGNRRLRKACRPQTARLILLLGFTTVWLALPVRRRLTSVPPPAAEHRPQRRTTGDSSSTLGATAPLVLTVMVLLLWRRRDRPRRHEARHVFGQHGSLRYHVPVGQDPAAVMAALRQEGYQVARDQTPTRIQDVFISRPATASLERAEVRAIIEQAPIDLEGAPAPPHPVVFADEPSPRPQAIT